MGGSPSRADRASLRAVMTWSRPMAPYGVGAPLLVDMDLGSDTKRALGDVLVETLGGNLAVEVSAIVVEGHTAVELLKAAQTAELLVVGSRGHGAFAGMLLGSVSEDCVSHSSCPVVVVRHTDHPVS